MNRQRAHSFTTSRVLRQTLRKVSALALLLPCSAPLYGQDVTSQGGDAGESTVISMLESITVTARRREETLLEIPETVTALSAGMIEQQGIDNLRDIGALVSNLNLSVRTDGFPNVTIRGIGGFGNTQGVGFYLDDVQLFSDASSRFGDLDRIEVLKGPQGTLYGGSNIGGAIKFVSARPDPAAISGKLKTRMGERNLADIEGSLNLPLGDSGWAARAFGFHVEEDGFLTNRNPPRMNGVRGDNDPDIGAIQEQGARVSLAGPLGDRLSAYASFRWNKYDGVGNAWIREVTDDFRYDPAVNNSANSDHVRETYAGTVELEMKFDRFTALALSSYTDTETNTYTDVDMREELIFDVYRPHALNVFTQELRFTSNGSGPFSWIAGAYYSLSREEIRASQIWFDARVDEEGNITGPLGCAAGMPTCSGVWTGVAPTPAQEMDSLVLPLEFRNRDKSHLAAFANLSYDWDDWELDVGVRVDQWKNETVNIVSAISSSKDDVEILPRVSISRWLTGHSMLYFTYAQGYEPGGYNLANFAGVNDLFGFDIEKSSSFELGMKSSFLDNRISLGLAAFLIDYKDRQIEYAVQSGDQLVEGIVNIGDSESYGVEAELAFRATDSLSLAASIGFIEAEWKNGTRVDVGGSLIDLGGTAVPYTNDVSWMLSANYDKPLNWIDGVSLIAGAQLSYNGEYEGLYAWDPVRNPDYTVLNLQLGLRGERWELLLQMENATDEAYFTDVARFPNLYAIDGGETVNIGTLAPPRTFSATVGYRF